MSHGDMPRVQAAGALAWAVLGVAALCVASTLLIVVLRPLVLALLVALLIAIVFLPIVDVLARRRIPRAIGAAAAMLIVIGIGAGATILVVWGVADQLDEISRHLSAAIANVRDLVARVGVDAGAAHDAEESARASAGTVVAGVLPSVGNVLGVVVNVMVGVFVALFVGFFLLKDGHGIADRIAGLTRLPAGRGHRLLGEAATTIRRYFVGLTVLGVFNAVVVGAGAVILDVPMVGAIAVITLLCSYIPYLGAPIAGAYAVLIALGAGGESTALWMLLVVVLANTVLQYIVAPFAFGAALQMSPLVVLLVTLVGGALAGVIGLTLAAPLTAIVTTSVRLLKEPTSPVT